MSDVTLSAQKIVAQPDFAKQLLTVGGETGPSTPASLEQEQERNVAMWRDIAHKMPELVEAHSQGQ